MNETAKLPRGFPEGNYYQQQVLQIYREDYAQKYAARYIVPWRRKHDLNLKNISQLLASLPVKPGWLDLACGPAWHFSRLRGWANMLGVDLSEAQLALARRNAPDATFLRGDMSRMDFGGRTFDLVTNFWAGYCYLGSQARIAALLQTVAGRLGAGGCLYFEVLLPQDLENFNGSLFSGQTGFQVSPRSSDFTEWQYDDSGGRHLMTSPPLNFFLDLLTPHFRQVTAQHDSAFMTHLIATGRQG
jgi:SAM-dependent methyltransferase